METPSKPRILLQTQELFAQQAAVWPISRWPVWQLAFRPFFLAGSAFAALAMAAWLLLLTGRIGWHSGLTPTLWHAHEMLFGFGGAVAMGFLLTAAQTWTGVRSTGGVRLALLFAVWLGARILLWRGADSLSLVAALLCEAAWWLGGVAALANMLLRARNRRNYLFLPLLGVMMCLDLALLAAALSGHLALATHLARTAMLQFSLLMGVVGGRVIPFFTVNALGDVSQRKTPRLDRLILIAATLGVLVFFTGYFLPLPFSPAWIMLLVAGLHGYRHLHWYPHRVLGHPLLWSLHLSYLALSSGIALIGLSFLLPSIPFKDVLHLVTVGAMGLMILAMMSRVSLGHTARPLRASRRATAAYLLLAVAALARALGPQWVAPIQAWLLSGLCWTAAFSLFLWQYLPILSRPRLDGRQG